MTGLIRELLEAAQTALDGTIGVINVFGDGNQLVVAIILAVLAALALRFIPTIAGDIIAAIFGATALYAVVTAFGLSGWIGMVAAVGLFGYWMFKLVQRAREDGTRLSTGIAGLMLALAVFAGLGLLTVMLPAGQFERDLTRAGEMVGQFIGGLLNAAQGGAEQVKE